MTNNPEDIRLILETYKTVAVVGLSPRPDRPSFGVASFLQGRGFTIVPVRPGVKEVLGETAYPDLKSIPQDAGVEVVEIFRRSEHVPPIVDDAIAIGAKAVWMQDGVEDVKAAEKAREAGLRVVMNDCMARQLLRMTQ